MAVIVYHSNCADGIAAATVVGYFLNRAKKEPINSNIYIPAQYGEKLSDLLSKYVPPKPIPASDLYIVDFSFPLSEIVEQSHLFDNIIILDHHATAIKKFREALAVDFQLPKNVTITFDEQESGATLAWKHFNPMLHTHSNPEEPPILIQYIKDRDLWQWQLPESKEINAWISLQDKTPAGFQFILDGKTPPMGKYMMEGTLILKVQQVTIDNAVKNGTPWKKHPNAIIVNSGCFQSEIGDTIIKTGDASCAAIFFIDAEKRKAIFSLRSRNGIALIIAEKYGGGGHPNACGFQIPLDKLGEFL